MEGALSLLSVPTAHLLYGLLLLLWFCICGMSYSCKLRVVNICGDADSMHRVLPKGQEKGSWRGPVAGAARCE